ncbi:methyltransferase family protein [Chromatocurvus halotolerans]|uniref:Protein-S-isoprenylcysteine O-methyltransferase Ste14 n=1 Tax=Chromatocurvus halotolerans TaxID=1132028 RepID=A0A4V2SAF0_9GAMM|nr:isoprenylcysteine carboxylmethyltransferase family protein [Chromatocurvus halotolerans]TCO71440.1 protein-S-isoprenylcysteine O-methyltransferase Ste14 [Chromatocurvus halotolerans]
MTVKRIIYPPMWLVFGVMGIFALNEFAPVLRYTGPVSQLIGGIIMLVGLALLVVSGGLFSRAGTGMVPFRDVKVLVTNGVYARTRNPMYLAMALVLAGVAVTVGALSALIVPPLFLLIVYWRYVRPEEAMLQDLFGDEYAAYCSRVRRWL